jgi:hypothetical protein|tara:strand:- start:1486 stop:2460 length:975 start_codon:yes stop_codon:yes gene_type:complete
MEAEEQIVEDSSSETTEAQIDETEASSSDAVETEESLLSVVQDALPVEEEVQQAEEVPQEETEEVMEAQSEETAEAESEDFSDVPFNKHPRFRKLIAEKNEQKELATKYQTDSEQYAKITNFIEQNNLSAKDAVEGFKLMAMLRNNPEEGYKRLQGHMDNIGKLTGQNLPEDIQSKVDDGYLDEDAAKELSQARANLSRERSMRQHSQKRFSNAEQSAGEARLSDTIKTWGETTLANDPDFSLKQDEFNDRISALVSERGKPKSPEDVLSIANDAYDTINERFKSRQPSKQPMKSTIKGKLGGVPVAEASNMRDIVSQALQMEG